MQKELAAFQRDTEICLSNDAQHLLVDQSTSGEVVHFFQGWRTLAFLPLSPLPCVVPLVSFPVLQCRRGEKGIKERRRRKDESKILAFQGLRRREVNDLAAGGGEKGNFFSSGVIQSQFFLFFLTHTHGPPPPPPRAHTHTRYSVHKYLLQLRQRYVLASLCTPFFCTFS